MDQFHYIELDGSFKGAKPFTFCVAQEIIFNESYPFALTIASTESSLLYEMIFDDINSNAVCPFVWNGRYILSDIRKALIAICSKYWVFQISCEK